MTDDSPESDRSGGTDGGVTNWLLLEGDRLVIAGRVVLLTFLALLAVLWTYGLDSLNPKSPVYFLFGSLLTGDMTLLTVVLSINQLVLARELGAPGTLQERIDGAVRYLDEVEAVAETGVSPKSPPGFLRYLHESVESRANALEGRAPGVRDETLQRRIGALADSLLEDVRRVNRTLERERPQIFSVVSATLATNHASQLQEIAEFREEHADRSRTNRERPSSASGTTSSRSTSRGSTSRPSTSRRNSPTSPGCCCTSEFLPSSPADSPSCSTTRVSSGSSPTRCSSG